MVVEKVCDILLRFVEIRLLIGTVVGTLEGYDQLMNLVLDHVKETMRGKLSLKLRLRYF